MNVELDLTEGEEKIIEKLKRPGEGPSDVLRRALHSLDREEWRKRADADMERIAASGENLADEPDDWGPEVNSSQA